MKRVLKALLCFLPLVVLVSGVNLYADPANLFKPGYERGVAEIMAHGDNAANIRNMDDRELMREYAALHTQPIGTLVLGSSRSMQFTRQNTGDDTLFCAGVTGGDVRDCISVYRLLRENGARPQRVVLVLDYWYLSEGCLDTRAMTEGYYDFCEEHGLAPVQSGVRFATRVRNTAERAAQVVSVPYFQQGVEFLKKGLQHARDPVPTAEFYSETDMRRADGSYGYNAQIRGQTPEEAAAEAHNLSIVTPDVARNFTGISSSLQAQLEAFFADIAQDGAQLIVVTPPLHPDYYAFMQQRPEYDGIRQAIADMRAWLQTLDVVYVGDYDPMLFGMDGADFYDGFHYRDTSLVKFFPAALLRE